ncbi:Uncharacterized protein FWK35_00011477 [Aphis craccivora]|uniref:Uncharacterized protein n=1 Tax=Aphis craccivora TaxID=307492 RepID=A0A6G0ZBS5_APHCR|nr:Uncharacterized protein FWK35_00011477 [Aphis craccivora]
MKPSIESRDFANNYAKKLELHTNTTTKQLFDNLRGIRRLIRLKPYDLVYMIYAKKRDYIIRDITPNMFLYAYLFK